jgi:glycerol uptake facilitator-like aquaporin
MYNYIVEFLGTVFFVYVILATANPLAIGAALALIILLARNTSGGHVNPAVSLAMAASGALPSTELFPYVIAQSMGALVAHQIYIRFQL